MSAHYPQRHCPRCSLWIWLPNYHTHRCVAQKQEA